MKERKEELLASYDYFLPENLIASKPSQPKENAKLLVYHRKTKEIQHLHFYDLPNILPACDIVFNNTKVVKARIFGKKESGGKIELLLNQALSQGRFSVYIRGKVKVGSLLSFDEGLKAEVLELDEDGSRIVTFSRQGKILSSNELFELLDLIGHVPLPPYIKREDEKEDEFWYQTVFAEKEGAVAAPTASLHFDEKALELLAQKHEIFYITLHVGAGTFKSVESERIADHKMHEEYYELSDETAELLDSSRKILGVGTTVTRTIEFYARTKQKSGYCNLFLNPQNKPIRQDYLLTNFHLPKSTLIMLVASFIGLDETQRIYKEAIEQAYKFYSYGDAMLIL